MDMDLASESPRVGSGFARLSKVFTGRTKCLQSLENRDKIVVHDISFFVWLYDDAAVISNGNPRVITLLLLEIKGCRNLQRGSLRRNHCWDCAADTSMDQSLSPDSSDTYNVFGEPKVLPRVGEEYQIEVPSLLSRYEYFVYSKNPFELGSSASRDFLIGLPVPLPTIIKESECFKNEGPGESSIQGSKQEVEHLWNHKYGDKGIFLIPGLCNDLWTKSDEASFLLGLYIFGKNLVQVMKFVGNKTMGDVQSFYYGKFYRSDEYKRWSGCRKMKRKGPVCGKRIFTGWRHQELLSRLYCQVPEECQNTLLEISKSFLDGKMLLEEYVFTLQGIVGINSLVEAVAIGRGKQDLTGDSRLRKARSIETSKSNQNVKLHTDIPVGKACSSLTPEQIIKFLSGDFRLSKARSNDLFWEAVWPRLLARGWHSEQPEGQIYTVGAKHSLVFLVPGVEEFSRRKLVKGEHFFVSVTDVLSKVASEPGLLNLETDADEANANMEATNTGQEDLLDVQSECDLKPQTPIQDADRMMITVVDTSLVDGELFKLREFITLPNEEVPKMTLSGSSSEESNVDSPELLATASRRLSTRNRLPTARALEAIANGYLTTSTRKKKEKENENISYYTNYGAEGHRPNVLDLNLPQPSPGTEAHGASMMKAETFQLQQNEGRDIPVAAKPSSEMVSSEQQNERRDIPVAAQPSSEMVSSEQQNKGRDIPVAAKPSSEMVSSEQQNEGRDIPVAAEPSSEMVSSEQQNEGRVIPVAAKPSSEMVSSEQQQNTTLRRQSTRNWPPTARALEALANGYLTTNTRKKKKNKEDESSSSRPSRRARVGTEVVAAEDFSAAAYQTGEAGNSV